MSEISKNEQLIHALLDGELNPSESQKVRALLKSDPSMGRLLEQFRQHKEDLSQLPRFSLPENFSDRVLIAAKEVAPHRDTATATGVVSQTQTGFSAWQIVATAVLSSAATLLLSLFLLPSGSGPQSAVASYKMVRPTDQIAANESVDAATDFELADSIENESQLSTDEVAKAPVQLSPAQPALVQPAPVQPAADTGQQQFAGEAIEQVWLLDSQDEASKEELIKALSNNSIQLPVAAVSSSLAEVNSAIDEEIDGILIDATSQQMRKALIELADSQKFEISAFPLPGHETYSADVQNQIADQQADQQTQMVEVEMADAPLIASETGSLPRESQNANVESFDAMAAKVIEDVKAAGAKDAEGSSSPYQWPSLKAPAKALAQQLRGRRFTNVRKEDALSKAKVAALDDAPEGMMGADADGAGLYSLEADASYPMPTVEQLELADVSPGGALSGDEADEPLETLKATEQASGSNFAALAMKRSVDNLQDKVVADEKLAPAAPEVEQQNLKELFPQDKLDGDRRGNYLLLIRNSKSPSRLRSRPRTTQPRTTRPRTSSPR